jgi:protein SCO1/2
LSPPIGHAPVRYAPLFILSLLALGACARSEASPSGATRRENAPLAPFEGVVFRDQHGRELRRDELVGQALLVNFMFTSCASVCPSQTRDLSQLARSLPEATRARIRFLSISVDPENDTPDALAGFAREHGANLPFWSFGVAAPERTKTLVTSLGAFDAREPAPTPASHTTSAYLFDPSGHLVQRYAGLPFDRARLTREIEQVTRLSSIRR